jgi:predicted lipase
MKKDLQFGLIFRNEENPDHILIAFRGTVTTMEWWDDAQASPTDFLYYNQERGGPSLKVEVGFFSIYRSIRDQLFSFIETHNPNQITITGHSLGSALATLFLYELRLLYPQRPTSSYNYASPRVGGPNFVQALSLQSQPPTSPSTEALIRFRNLSDVVPDVPFTWESYEHSPWQFSLNFKEKEGLLPDYALRHSADNYFLALRKIFALPDYEATLFNEKQDDFILLKE